MQNYLDRQRRQSKKSCFMCKCSPQNILMLACNDSICLQCAYFVLKDSSIGHQNSKQIEFRCKKCNQVTYFDGDLIKQIENSILPQKIKMNPINQYNSMKNQRIDESFIEKMKKQYLTGDNKLLKKHFQSKKEIMNQSMNVNKKKIEIPEQNDLSLANQYFINNQRGFQSKQRVSKQRIQKKQQSYCKISPSQLSQNTKCKTHSYYDLIYYCVQCQQIVCSQCLLRGKHKDHKNESINQILQHELPKFINKTSQKLLAQVNQVETIKDNKYFELNKKISQINNIRQNAFQYFNQIKRNIEKQEYEVIQRCDELLQNLRKQQKQIESQQNDVEMRLACYINEIKSLKSSYKQFLEFPHEKSNKILQKSLIQRFIQYSQTINEFFENKSQTKNSIKHNFLCNINEVENGSRMLNKHIQQSIESIRQSLVFDNYSQKFNNLINQQKFQSTESQQSRLSFMKPCLNKKLNQKPPINSYISYMSTDNSPQRNKNIKKQQKSISISPYKRQCSFQKTYQAKLNIPKRNQTTKQVHDIQKQNIYIQHHQKQSKTTKLSSQASSQNVSSKKYTNLSKNSSISKSKNNSITKKKHSKITNNTIAKFQV